VILLTIAPAFLSAGMYIMLKSLVILFGPQYSRLPPNAYAYVFVSADVVSIILQGVGGAISAVATKKKLLNQGVDIMIAGLVSQVFTLCIFAGLCVDFAMQVKKNHDLLPPARQKLIKSLRFKFTAGALAFAFLCIQIRCIYRVAELSQGWGSELMRKENDFIIMDSLLVTQFPVDSNNMTPNTTLLTHTVVCASPPPPVSPSSTLLTPCRSPKRPWTIRASKNRRGRRKRDTA
jgi:hypothetical protein